MQHGQADALIHDNAIKEGQLWNLLKEWKMLVGKIAAPFDVLCRGREAADDMDDIDDPRARVPSLHALRLCCQHASDTFALKYRAATGVQVA